MKKKLLTILLGLVLITTLTGCSLRKPDSSKKEWVSAMETEYREDFRFLGWEYQEMGGPDRIARMECASMPGKTVLVQKLGTDVLSDNYMLVKYEDTIENELAELTEKIYPDSRVFFFPDLTMFGPDLAPDLTPEEVMQEKQTTMNVTIVAQDTWNRTEQTAKLERWRQAMADRGFKAEGRIYITDTDPAGIAVEELPDWRRDKENYQGNCYFAMNQEGEFYYANWRNAKQNFV